LYINHIIILEVSVYYKRYKAELRRIYREPYQANSKVSVADIITNPTRFYCLTRFEPQVWLDNFLNPIYSFITYPRNFHNTTDLNVLNHTFPRRRSAQIDIPERLFRWNLILRGIPINTLTWIFDQSISTLYADFHHISKLVLHVFWRSYLYHPTPGSVEYNGLVGHGAFRDFNSVVYAADVVKVGVRCPTRNHRTYFDGHHWKYTAGYWCACDGNGVVRMVFGHSPGSYNDLRTLTDCSDFENNMVGYLSPGHKKGFGRALGISEYNIFQKTNIKL